MSVQQVARFINAVGPCGPRFGAVPVQVPVKDTNPVQFETRYSVEVNDIVGKDTFASYGEAFAYAGRVASFLGIKRPADKELNDFFKMSPASQARALEAAANPQPQRKAA